jgi:hypothetical protein
MQVKTVTISLPLINSLLLHTVVAALVLMLPIYGGSAGQRSFMSYLVFLTNGEGPVPSHTVSVGEKHDAAGEVRAQEKPAPEKAARPQEKAEVEKVRKTPEKIVSPGPVEKTAPGAVPPPDNAAQNVPPKTEDVKADAEMAEEVVKEPAETNADKEVEEKVVSSARETSRPAATPLPVPGTEQFMKELLPDTEALLRYQGGSEGKAAEAGEQKEAAVSEPGSEKTGPPEVAAGQRTTPQNEAPEGAAAKKTGAGVTAPALPATPAAGPPAGGQQVAGGAASPALAQGEMAGQTGPVEQQQAANEAKQAPIGISGAAALLPRDIIIKVVVSGDDGSAVYTRLSRRNYPSAGLEHVGGKDSPVKAKEESSSAGGTLAKRILSVVNADKGIYTFVIGNAGTKTCIVNAVFLLFEKTRRERIKEYKVIQLAPGTGVKFKFLVPDAIFWDDDDRFTGSMEDSDSITKFNSDTGLVWRESKDD